MTIHSFIHLVATLLRLVASASSDKFYDFYAMYSGSVLDSDCGYSISYGQLSWKILPPVHFLNGFLRNPDLYPL